MASFLLETKLRIPRRPRYEVLRAWLNDTLEANILHYKLILFSAPAGYGKTTQMAQWVRMSRIPIVWLTLESSDKSLDHLLRYLLAGWEQVQPDVRKSPFDILLSTQPPDQQSALAAFLNAVGAAPDPIVFVLDDYHLIEDESIHQGLIYLLDHAPQNLHFVLGVRNEPPLPLARYRARSEVLEFRENDLRFQINEARVFLKDRMMLGLTEEKIRALHTQLEGWVAGLQLAALSARRAHSEAYELVIGGRQRFLADYLAEEVFQPLPPVVQQFLLQTCILERLSASLCEAVTQKKGGQDMLEDLERENLFLVPLDENREWFRYHALFADFLTTEMAKRDPDKVAELHRRAANWYLDHKMPDAAFQHALKANNVDTVVQIFERYLFVRLLGGEIRLVQQWLAALPVTWHSHHPMLIFARAAVFLVTGQFNDCMTSLEEVERLVLAQNEEAALYHARVTAMRCNIACFQNDLGQAETLADEALQILPREELDLRAGVYGALGDTYRRNGRWEEAYESYQKLLGFVHAPTFQVQAVHVYGALADLELWQGHLHRAAGHWRKALEAIQQRENWGSFPLPLTGWVYIRMGELLYEWNERAEAWEHLSKGIERAELGGDVQAMIAGYVTAARLKLAERDLEGTALYLVQAKPHVEVAEFSYWIDRFERVQLDLWLAQDRTGTAVQWVEAHWIGLESGSETAQLSAARVLIAKGDSQSMGRARVLLERLLTMAEEAGRKGIEIEAFALKAILHEKRGDHAAAMITLEHALRLAHPEGYVRLFSDLGLHMFRLLRQARSRKVMPAYVEKLLEAFGSQLSLTVGDQEVLPEALTRREEEVLERMAAGLTNRQIAEQLVITPETVKKHAANIYGKLGVHSRIEAVNKARTLGLLNG